MLKRLFISLLLGIAPFSLAQQAEETYPPVNYPSGYSAQLNTVYVTVGDWKGLMDLYLPAAGAEPSPLVINIHGGGWNKGTKNSQRGFGSFFKRGYAVANMGYRLVQIAPAPAAVEDVRCALIYLIKNADTLNIDTNKIVITGGSAGAHLALMGGLLANDRRFDGNCPGVEKEIRVAAIINKFGVADVGDWAHGKHTSRSATTWLGAGVDDIEFQRSVSPYYQVKADSPPVFTVHGDTDPIVPYQQSVDLHKKLDELKVKNQFVTVEGGGHGKFPDAKNKEVTAMSMRFLDSLGL
jgi:acetyl esterase/lipase